ncbi:MAG: NAD(P)H-hydrate dehydratase [Terriglobales bacterium]
MFLLSAAQSRELERAAIEDRGVAGGELMAQAAAAVVVRLERDFPAALAGHIAVLCGGGNNGGDGLVLTRLLRARGVAAEALLFADPARLSGDAETAFTALRAAEQSQPRVLSDAAAWDLLRAHVLGCTLIVDALFGTGLLRPVRGWLAQVMGDINRGFKGAVLAVDIPSGMSADAQGGAESEEAAVLRAHATVTFAAPKLGHYLSHHRVAVGDLSVAPIGIPDDLMGRCGCAVRVTTPLNCAPFLLPRPRDAHKGSFGHVLVVAGSLGKSGAAVLASTAALRMGAGLVTAAVPRSILPIVAAARAELMTEALPETRFGALTQAGLDPAVFMHLLRPASVLALGPGVGQARETAEFVRFLVTAAKIPCVLDADGLNAFAGRRAELRVAAGAVLTPHPGEMGRLFQVSAAAVQERRRYYTERLAAETGAVALLKGERTLLADPDGAVFVNPTGNPGMATAGSGDVLTGLIAGLLAQFPAAPRLLVAAAAAYLHGAAGDRAAAEQGEMTMLAGDILRQLPAALSAVARECHGRH